MKKLQKVSLDINLLPLSLCSLELKKFINYTFSIIKSVSNINHEPCILVKFMYESTEESFSIFNSEKSSDCNQQKNAINFFASCLIFNSNFQLFFYNFKIKSVDIDYLWLLLYLTHSNTTWDLKSQHSSFFESLQLTSLFFIKWRFILNSFNNIFFLEF